MTQTTTATPHRHTNRLIHETSPYLLQHAHNPVDWHPWGAEALAKSKAENKPILLSIGYSACHWCHVMEHESFENEAIAKIMNDHFINVKVDREERPDLDTIYMNAVQMMGQRGGWPLTVFLTPEGVPFYGGTYFPPVDRYGMPGFPRLLLALVEAYEHKRAEIEESASSLLHELRRLAEVSSSADALQPELLEQAANHLMRAFDPVNGGFGRAPKFPPAMTLSFLLRQHGRTQEPALLAAVELTLDKMARGGMYDQLGGGFHRYSVDEKWLVPHFEKMLYDNALLARLYLDASLVTGKEFYRQIVTETLDYVRREMTDANGGFYSTQDADSEGAEGKFFVWTPAEVTALLGEEEARLFNRYFDVTEEGNFEGHNILHVDNDVETVAKLLNVTPERLQQVLVRGKQLLFDARERRIKPGRDEKMLTAWNGLMLRSFAEAAQVLSRSDYLEVATRNAKFVLSTLKRDGRLLRTHKDGESKLNAYQEDYAYLIDGLLALYEASFEPRWFAEARALADTMIEQFWDAEQGGFFFTSADHEALISRTKDFFDNATPAGNAVAAHVLLRLALFTGEARYRELAEQVLRLTAREAQRMPNGFGHTLCALDLYLAEPYEIAVIGAWEAPGTAEMLTTIFQRYLPNKIVALAPPQEAEAAAEIIPFLAGRKGVAEKTTAYVCRNWSCAAPVTQTAQLSAELN
jgi:uncharacterized protein YyaL (SSP411 family)